MSEDANIGPDGRPITKESARELVNKISEKHGYLGEDTLSQMSLELRRKVEHALLMKDEMIGSSVITLAKNLYNSSARFVFELLQNADDNSYTRAKSASVAPFVSFRVYRNRIIIECNEDGFTAENLVAICDVGHSSKTGAQGYIGEKGIGFKSVFMVAWKVHIQSGCFSFSFHHKKQDSGMGMISPVWEETDETLNEPLTRITLYLHETGARDTLARQRQTTLQQFRELQATFLLFMKNLRKIDVAIYDDDDNEPASTSTFSMEQRGQDRVYLKKETVTSEETQDHTQYYHITRETVADLPQNENRRYTDAEVVEETYSSAEIVLAFPLTQDSVPIVEPQDVFAFLPFLIQSDFVTDASRQDIVRSSARNARLLTAAAWVFVRAVSQFCDHPTLRFQWMRYLPNDKEHSWDPFWTRFLDNIRMNLKATPNLWTKTHSKLRCIEDMRRVPSTMMDRNGEPLFPDLNVEQYIAVEYLKKDLDILTNYGLRVMGKREFLDRVRQDQNREDDSIMFDPDTDDDWHSRVAKILIDCWSQYSGKMKDLALVPSMKGEWMSTETLEEDNIYFSQVAGYSIPRELMLRLVDPRAEKNPHRRGLFSLLGAKEVQISNVRKLTIRYLEKDIASGTTVKNFISTVVFLYQTAHLDQKTDNERSYKGIKLVDQLSKAHVAMSHTFYLPTDDPYGAQQLLQPLDSEEDTADTASHNVSILHQGYMSECSTQPEGESLTWKTWLTEKLDVRDVIPLADEDDLTKECLYVAERYPERFLGFLLKYWESDGGYLAENQSLIDRLLKIKVLCESGDVYILGETYIRSPQLEYIDPFLYEDEFFPWLKHDASLGACPGFSDLDAVAKVLGFGYPKTELEFYLTALRFIVEANQDASKTSDFKRLCELYGRIEVRHHESLTVDMSREMICDAFKTRKLIYIPAYDDMGARWADPKQCLWEAPGFMTTKFPLKHLYKNIQDTKYIAEFFQNTLAISDAGIDDFVAELLEMSEKESANPDNAYELYCLIDKMRPDLDDEDIENIRVEFEDGALIYHEGDGCEWHSPSSCLWSNATDMKGMVTLNDIYQDLPDFFVDLLGVPTLTREMVYRKLVEQGAEESSIADVKNTIWTLNSFLHDSNEVLNPKKAMESKVLPVRHPDGTVELCSSTVDFAIVDRKHLAHLFADKAKVLDFGINDVRRLEPFLHWAGLDSRYLSLSVKEISAVCGDSHRALASADRDISQKAHGLLRIAADFKSPRVKKSEQAFYELLRGIAVCETDGLSSELHLNQDGKDITVEVGRCELHFQETKDGLTIYVPRNKQDQYLCFLDRMPRALLQWIMTEPSTGICEPLGDLAVNVMSNILKADRDFVSLTLDRAGIMSVETEDELADNAAEISVEHNDPHTPLHRNQGNPTSDAASSTLYEASVVSTEDERMSTTGYARASQPAPRVVNNLSFTPQRARSTRSPPPPVPEPAHEIANSEYLRLLNNVIDLARRYEFPSRGPFDMAGLSQTLDGLLHAGDTETYRLRTSEKIERDKMIGAAGEVFVFEVLSALDPVLPAFSGDNWQSTIRRYVRIHEDYADMEPWAGRETADITYNDSDGVFTSFLIDKGYLASDVWTGARPYYYLEVKATTLSWETPFYMSGSQYERMKTISQGESGSAGRDSVYVIFRIFKVGRTDMGMKVYVDPNSMRERGELSFTADTWSIVPGLV